MWNTVRHSALLPATVAAIIDLISQFRPEPKLETLARLDDHLLRDIGLERGTVGAPHVLVASESDPEENPHTAGRRSDALYPVCARAAATASPGGRTRR